MNGRRLTAAFAVVALLTALVVETSHGKVGLQLGSPATVLDVSAARTLDRSVHRRPSPPRRAAPDVAPSGSGAVRMPKVLLPVPGAVRMPEVRARVPGPVPMPDGRVTDHEPEPEACLTRMTRASPN